MKPRTYLGAPDRPSISVNVTTLMPRSASTGRTLASVRAVRRPRPLLEARQRREGGQKRPLGGVLGVVMIAKLVIRVAVHLGEIPAIQGVEAERVASSVVDERSIAVEVGNPAG